jgi:transposase
MNEFGQVGEAVHVGHDREQFREFLRELPAGSPIAVEASGHYYRIVDEMESAGHHPQLTNPLRAKQMMGDRKKTDKVDARALAPGGRGPDACGCESLSSGRVAAQRLPSGQNPAE